MALRRGAGRRTGSCIRPVRGGASRAGRPARRPDRKRHRDIPGAGRARRRTRAPYGGRRARGSVPRLRRGLFGSLPSRRGRHDGPGASDVRKARAHGSILELRNDADRLPSLRTAPRSRRLGGACRAGVLGGSHRGSRCSRRRGKAPLLLIPAAHVDRPNSGGRAAGGHHRYSTAGSAYDPQGNHIGDRDISLQRLWRRLFGNRHLLPAGRYGSREGVCASGRFGDRQVRRMRAPLDVPVLERATRRPGEPTPQKSRFQSEVCCSTASAATAGTLPTTVLPSLTTTSPTRALALSGARTSPASTSSTEKVGLSVRLARTVRLSPATTRTNPGFPSFTATPLATTSPFFTAGSSLYSPKPFVISCAAWPKQSRFCSAPMTTAISRRLSRLAVAVTLKPASR